MKHIIPKFDEYLNEMQTAAGAFAQAYIENGIVVKFSRDESDFYAWNKLLDTDIYSKFPQSPKIYGLHIIEELKDKKFVIVQEEIEMIPDEDADLIEETLIQKFKTSYIEEILKHHSWRAMFKNTNDITYELLDYCEEYDKFCRKNEIKMNVIDLQNIGYKDNRFAIFDMGESTVNDYLTKNYSIHKTKSKDIQEIVKELIQKHKK